MPLNKVQFGAYELDRDAMELSKHGHRVRLQDQPLLVLVALLERPGEIVSREQLQERIWAKDTFVDFDQSLNKAVNRLRETLNDDAGQPLYIETVPRRGYRFVAPVTGIVPSAVVPEPQQRVDLKPGANRTWRWATAGILVAVAIGAFLWMGKPRQPDGAARRVPIQLTTHGWTYGSKISRDGKLLAYSSSATGEVMHIWVQQIAGGEPIQVTRGPDADWAPDFSPDNTQIIFHSERDSGGIFIVPTFGGEPRLVRRGKVTNPVFSPDGTQILYSRADTVDPDLWVVPTRGGEPRRLVSPEYNPRHALWSPDGTAILLGASKREDPNQVESYSLIRVGGGTLAPFVLPGDAYQDVQSLFFVSWRVLRGGRQWLVFGKRNGDTSNLFRVAINAGGGPVGNVEQITSGTGFMCCADFSEDGSLVYVSGTVAGQIRIIPADTNRAKTQGEPQQITHSEGVVNTWPTVSRDGRWLAYSSERPNSGDASIRLRDLKTGAERELVGGIGLRGHVSISPDGSKVAYAEGKETPSTFVISAAGGSPTKICDACYARGFSANGSLLLTQQFNPNSGLWRVVAVPVAGGHAKDFIVHATQDLFHPFFSWDDRWVCFKMLVQGNNARIMVAPVRNGAAGIEKEWISVTDGQYVDDKPQFSPDGNTLYFNSTRDGHLCVWAQRLDPATKRPVGEPIAVQHFHELQPWLGIDDNAIGIQLWVTKDKLVTNLWEFHGGLWMTKID